MDECVVEENNSLVFGAFGVIVGGDNLGKNVLCNLCVDIIYILTIKVDLMSVCWYYCSYRMQYLCYGCYWKKKENASRA